MESIAKVIGMITLLTLIHEKTKSWQEMNLQLII